MKEGKCIFTSYKFAHWDSHIQTARRSIHTFLTSGQTERGTFTHPSTDFVHSKTCCYPSIKLLHICQKLIWAKKWCSFKYSTCTFFVVQILVGYSNTLRTWYFPKLCTHSLYDGLCTSTFVHRAVATNSAIQYSYLHCANIPSCVCMYVYVWYLLSEHAAMA